MKRLFYLLFLIFHLQLNLLFSQNNPGKFINEVNIIAARNAVGGLTYDNIEGSPYYSDLFVNSVVHLKSGDSTSLPLRYDLFQDEIEFKRDKQIFWIIKKDILYIRYEKEMLIPESVSKDPGKLTYFVAQEKGKYALYFRKEVVFYPKVPAKGYALAIPDRFERYSDEYFLKQEGLPVIKIKNKKVLSGILSDNEPALDFIKKSKIKVNNAEDLLELMKFLNNQ